MTISSSREDSLVERERAKDTDESPSADSLLTLESLSVNTSVEMNPSSSCFTHRWKLTDFVRDDSFTCVHRTNYHVYWKGERSDCRFNFHEMHRSFLPTSLKSLAVGLTSRIIRIRRSPSQETLRKMASLLSLNRQASSKQLGHLFQFSKGRMCCSIFLVPIDCVSRRMSRNILVLDELSMQAW